MLILERWTQFILLRRLVASFKGMLGPVYSLQALVSRARWAQFIPPGCPGASFKETFDPVYPVDVSRY